MSTAQTLVRDVMSKPLVTISPDATLVEAATRMRKESVNALLVPTTELAIVTSTDVLDAVAAERDPAAATVADVMTESVETVPPDLRLTEAAAMMENFGISHLPVVDDDLVGMVSSTDITAQHT
ncbi:CBS domain-containing protein [Halobellus litoreus]|uniref:Cyclic nucleotide-binding/CBS domain-containing protein n=1 Tax=Halobellus litoreus TaxID=755310 RepID=A0ABD6E4A4_9EURY|nr:CBS domain-containing protein [Halobellus litoreus]